MSFRIGNGFDVHRFSDDPTRPLVLGGVVFPGELGLQLADTLGEELFIGGRGGVVGLERLLEIGGE